MKAIVRRGALPFAILRETREWGIRTLDLVAPPARFWSDEPRARPVVEPGIDSNRVTPQLSPAQLLGGLPGGENWHAFSRRAVARLQAHFLLCEDPQRRLDARPIVTLAHQVSLARHVLEEPWLERVLIADEVGLGKTVEAGLIIQELLSLQPELRVLYLAPARLVTNVGHEFRRLDLGFGQWKAANGNARLSDSRIIASIHRAVHGAHFEALLALEPWDVIVIDECHHLSAWGAMGANGVRKYRLARDLAARQRPGGRLLLLSGTPHQGHPRCFQNLLNLLRRPGEEEDDDDFIRGRVIYRTKEDVRDWNGQPLFPLRQVNEPLVVDLGPAYRAWLNSIHEFYAPKKEKEPAPGTTKKPDPGNKPGETRTASLQERAAGWRCAQALQWAASSPQAGLGYLVRQAMRAEWTLEEPALPDALAALRPYRCGAEDEALSALFVRIAAEIARQRADADLEDIEEELSEEDTEAAALEAAKQKKALTALLYQGLEILRDPANPRWERLKAAVIEPAAGERIVLFAQPIETVTALARQIEREFGERPAMIIGGQSDEEREREVARFGMRDGPRFLISSRAGGEGINLQMARRLVHLDVPWNPMEMEQRVGRVHRFGSRRTILIDTLVVRESREADAYRVAREKLRLIASSLVTPDRFEALFSRVMCLVPPEDLQALLITGAAEPLTGADQVRIAGMVASGFQTWSEFHARFSLSQQRIRAQHPGLARWADVRDFLIENAGAQLETGFRAGRFALAGNEVEPTEETVEALRLADGRAYLVGDYEGALIHSEAGEAASALGLNLPIVAAQLRACAMPEGPVGAAHLRWTAEAFPGPAPAAVLVFLRQTLRSLPHTGWTEQAIALHCFSIAGPGEPAIPVMAAAQGDFLRAIFAAVVRMKPGTESAPFLSALRREETRLFEDLRRAEPGEIEQGIRYAVTPLFAALF